MPQSHYRSDRIIIKLKDGHAKSALLANKRGSRGHRVLKKLSVFDPSIQLVAIAPGETVAEAIKEYKSSGMVEFAEPDFQIRINAAPNDPNYTNGLLWRFNNFGQNGGKAGADIAAVKAWDIIHDAPDIVVAVLDSGIRYTHEDLADNMWVNPGEIPDNGIDDDSNGIVDDIHGINAVNDSGDPMDDLGHGTHVAGTIGAVGNNGKGVTGVAWKIKLMACKLLDNMGDGATSDAIQAIDYARQHGARIMNASWSGGDFSEGLFEAISNARNNGIIFVASAGNASSDNDLVPAYPSNFELDNIVVVCATSRNDTFETGYSSFGKTTVDLAAPGTSTYSTWFTGDNSYNYLTGTSMAAPIVAGAFALLKAKYPEENEMELISRVYNSVDPLPTLQDKCATGGRLNLERALAPKFSADFSMTPTGAEPPAAVSFSDQSTGEVSSWAWDFGDGSEVVTSQNPTHTYSDFGEFTVKLTVTSPTGDTRTKERKVLMAENYSVQTVDFAFLDPEDQEARMVLQLADDGFSDPVEIPFKFSFYGIEQTNLFVGANGVISFWMDGLESLQNRSLPNQAPPNSVIAPYWQDLNPLQNGSIWAQIVGAEPHRKLVITWEDIASKPGLTNVTFQAVIEESTEAIRFNYLEVHPEVAEEGGSGAVIGLEHPSGLLAAAVPTGTRLENNFSVQFCPKPRIAFNAETPQEIAFTKTPTFDDFAEPKHILLSNTGNVAVPWQCMLGSTNIVAQPLEGILLPGEVVQLELKPADNALNLDAGDYWSSVKITNLLNQTAPLVTFAKIKVIGAPLMEIVAPEDWQVQGKFGGPFSPATNTYVVINRGSARLHWKAESDTNFIVLDRTGGYLEPGFGVEISASLAPGLTNLHSGKYHTLVSFFNIENGAGDFASEIPINIAGNLHIDSTVHLDGNNFRFQFQGEPGRGYIVEKSTDLITWELLEAVFADQENLIEVITVNDGTLANCFFRIRFSDEVP